MDTNTVVFNKLNRLSVKATITTAVKFSVLLNYWEKIYIVF